MNSDEEAAVAASLFAVDAHGLGGVCLRSAAGPLRDQWLQMLRELLPPASVLRRIPFNIADSRLLGGLDLAATLRGGRPLIEHGVLAATHQGVLVVSMAERLSARTAGMLCGALDRGELHAACEGLSIDHAARIAVVALDEGMSDDECTPRCLLDRFAFLLDFSAADRGTQLAAVHDCEQVGAARKLLPDVAIAETYLRALCATAMALGAGSVRVTVLAVHAARILAALDGHSAVSQEDAELAGRLVLAPRASVMPEMKNEHEPRHDEPRHGDESQGSSPPPDDAPEPQHCKESPPLDAPPLDARDMQQMQEVVLAATQSAIPRGLLARLQAYQGAGRSARHVAMGRVGALRKGGVRGRPTGVEPAGNAKSPLNVIETLRAAAPWQSLRGRAAGDGTRLQIRSEDLRITRYKQRAASLTILVVDASGSSALNRLAEAKGAAELLLADCYVRRDQVAVIAFRGQTADVLLPPTRSLLRAKRSLSALPGGGGTPLAAAIDAAALMASQSQRRGESPTVVLLTDGRGNVARDGRTGREAGQLDAMRAARTLRAARIRALFVDTSARPHDLARNLARDMSATYIPLPFADARSLSKLVVAANSAGSAKP